MLHLVTKKEKENWCLYIKPFCYDAQNLIVYKKKTWICSIHCTFNSKVSVSETMIKCCQIYKVNHPAKTIIHRLMSDQAWSTCIDNKTVLQWQQMWYQACTLALPLDSAACLMKWNEKLLEKWKRATLSNIYFEKTSKGLTCGK